MAGGLKILAEGNVLDDETIDGLVSIIENAINSVTDDINKEKLEKAKDFLQKLKEAEMDSQKQDQEDINNLDTLLAGI